MKKILISLSILLLIVGLLVAQQRQRNAANAYNSDIMMHLDKLRITYAAITGLYVDEIDNAKLVEEAIKAMLNNLDPHSVYSDSDETRRVNEPLEANFEGIGIQFNMYMDTLYVIQVIAGGPSEKVGLLAGDRIVKVDETVIAGVKMSNTDVIKHIRGKKGTQVRIFVKRGISPDLIEFNIIRDVIPVFSLDAAYMADSKTGYIRLSRFSATTIDEFKTAFNDLRKEGMKNLILDLQENGGGYLHIAYSLANLFLNKGKLIVYTQGNKMQRSDIVSNGESLFEEGKLILLLNEASASASEIVAGAIQDWDRGVLVGRRSFGKGLVQRSIDLPDSSMIRLSVARYYTPSGRFIQKPYEMGNPQAYRYDIYDRYAKGELLNVESIHFPDSLKFLTLVSKRTVYGGGGIMPDVFVPIDSTRYTDYHSRLNRFQILSRTALKYIDNNRKELTKLYPDIKKFKEKFTISEALFQDLIALATEEKIEYDESQFNKSKPFISLQLKALIASDLFDNKTYFQIINEYNDAFQQALLILKNDELYNKILSEGYP